MLNLLPASLLALRDAPLTTSLKARCCEGLLCDLVFVLPQVSFAGERVKDEELLEDNSSFAGVSTPLRIKGSFPLLRAIERTARPLSSASFPRSRLFSIWPCNLSFSCCNRSARAFNSLICLACTSYMS